MSSSLSSSEGPAAGGDQEQELLRVRADLERRTVQLEEERTRRDSQHAAELKGLRKELHDAEAQHLALHKEILVLKDKLEKTRRERCVLCVCVCVCVCFCVCVSVCV